MVAKIPGTEKIVFRPGAVDGGVLFSVDKEHVVAFTPPAVLILKNGHGHAYKVSLSTCFQPHVVIFSIKVLLCGHGWGIVRFPLISPAFGGRCLTVLGMEIHGVGGKVLIQRLVVDVEIKRVDIFLPFIGDCDP